jgi:hypothetical protein
MASNPLTPDKSTRADQAELMSRNTFRMLSKSEAMVGFVAQRLYWKANWFDSHPANGFAADPNNPTSRVALTWSPPASLPS